MLNEPSCPWVVSPSLPQKTEQFSPKGRKNLAELVYPHTFMRVKRSLSVVNFKRRIASFAWCASSSAFAQRTRPSCIQHCLPLNAWRASRPTFAVRGYPSAAFYAAKLSPVPQHFASRQAPPLPRRLRAEPKINGRLSDARLDKTRFALIAQVFAEALPLPLPWLAHLCSLTHTLPPLSHNLYSYYHRVTCSFDCYSSFLFSFGSGLGVRDPMPRIGIVICPLFPFWRAGRPV